VFPLLNFAPDAGDHPLFEGGVGLGVVIIFIEHVVHDEGLLVSRVGGGVVL
jgi:hypothetical protein